MRSSAGMGAVWAAGLAAAGLVGCAAGPDAAAQAAAAARAEAALAPLRGAARVRFVAVGDTGRADAESAATGARVRAACAARQDSGAPGGGPGCDFVLLLGDLLYGAGATGPGDPRVAAALAPVSGLGVPVLAVPGNHDHGPSGLDAAAWARLVAAAAALPGAPILLPGALRLQAGPLELLLADSAALLGEPLRGDSGQRAVAAGWAAAPRPRWSVAALHHPDRSDGPHGDAGRADGGLWPVANGLSVRTFIDRHLAPRVDLLLAGHDHSVQWFAPDAGAPFTTLVSGAGGRRTAVAGGRAAWATTEPALVWVEATEDALVAVVLGDGGAPLRWGHVGGAPGATPARDALPPDSAPAADAGPEHIRRAQEAARQQGHRGPGG